VSLFTGRLPALALLCATLTPLDASTASSREWRFEVFLDDKPIGFHHFQLDSSGDTHQLRSEARFRVKVLGLIVYEYTHQSDEQWRHDCLQRIEASTDNNGKDFFVRGNSNSEMLLLESQAGNTDLRGCVMTFAYWNPAILEKQRLLNAQTGEYLDVTVQPLGEMMLRMQEREVTARHYRIRAGDRDIDLWYSTDSDWLALSSTTSSGRLLHYRRTPDPVDMRGSAGE